MMRSEPGRIAGSAGCRVLLVDDEAAYSFAVVRLLERAGHRVTTHPDAIAAAAELAYVPYDMPTAVVLDGGRSPSDLAGILAVLEVRVPPRPRLILVGSRADPMEAAKYRALGADAYLVKPFLAQELVAEIAPPAIAAPGEDAPPPRGAGAGGRR